MKLVYFAREMEEYVKDKIDELETNRKIKYIKDLYRGISDFKKGCEPRNNRIKEENGDMITDFIVF